MTPVPLPDNLAHVVHAVADAEDQGEDVLAAARAACLAECDGDHEQADDLYDLLIDHLDAQIEIDK